jgi:hypothetical protein
VGDAALDAAAGQPDAEAVGVMIAAIVALGGWSAAKLTAPNNQRVLQQASGAQVL